MDSMLREALEQSNKYQKPSFWDVTHRSIFIYGTGTFAREVQHVLDKRGVTISGFMDHRSRDETKIGTIRVFQPDDPSIERKQVYVLLGIHNREANILTIQENLLRLGYNNIVSTIDLYDHFAEELGNRYWLTGRDFYSKHTAEIEEAYGLFTDETSRTTFSNEIRFRITGDFSLLPTPDTKHQYFPPGLPAWESPLRLIDCGAYDGDAIRDILDSGLKIIAIAAFEPDQNNYRKLTEFAQKNLQQIHEMSLWPCGVYSKTKQLYFQSGQGEGSFVSNAGNTLIQCIAIDDALPNFSPTLIKMDIEGAELDALQGALNTIAKHKPGLAISAYHTPAHLWEIPLYINSFAKHNQINYTYHLRAHANNCFETVFYAIPIGN